METSSDDAARARAVDPRFNVALEASAGTGKTRVLVQRYINLLRAGVDPSNILALTFTRKAAAEMRDRIMATLKDAAGRGEMTPARWRELRDRTPDIAIGTIDAFCLSLLREFPLEADLDPAFSVVDDTERPRLVDEALDRALRICRSVALEDVQVALVFAQLGERRARAGLAALLNRRLVAPDVLATYAATGPEGLDLTGAGRRAGAGLVDVLETMRGGFDRFLQSGPLEPAFLLLARGLRQLRDSVQSGVAPDPGSLQAVLMRTRDHFLTQEGEPRTRSPYPKPSFASDTDWRVHKDLVVTHAEAVARVSAAYRRDLNVLVSRGVWRMFRIAEAEYRHTLDAHAVLDFSDLLLRALDLLRRMDDFAQSRYRLESRYHHVLVDEFQDTSRAQWELVSLLIQSWGQGAGLAHTGPLQPSIFIVGDRKQSIYGFRDADVSVLRDAARHLEMLRPDRDVRRSMSRSFRAVPPLLAFINDVCADIDKTPDRLDAFQYEDADRFPIDVASAAGQSETLGLVLADTPEGCAETTAGEIARLLSTKAVVRDRDTGVSRPIRAGDIGILFRTRESHRDFEAALERRAIRSYVYKGLGFFDADEIKDVLALVWYLADPLSDLRAAALMRSRFFGISDEALRLLAPKLSDALCSSEAPQAAASLDGVDAQALAAAREETKRWRSQVDRIPPAELVDVILNESAYAFELRGPRFDQARENLKKIRSLMRRMQNRGYSTIGRVAGHLDRLAVGDEANAVIDALDAVNLMTVHASKGLEFPVVFLVNLARGTGSRRDSIRLEAGAHGEAASVAVGDFQSDADEAYAAKEREETKRLLYVALTRARDRLYLGTTLKEGRTAPGRGSLADVLPHSLLDHFTAAAGDCIDWRASSGAVHRFRVCPEAEHNVVSDAGEADVPEDDFAPLVDNTVPPRTAASADEAAGGRLPSSATAAGHGESQRLIGRTVHQLLQRFGFDADRNDASVRETALRMLRPDAATGVLAVRTAPELADEVVAAYREMCMRPDIRALYASGEPLHEVPFTMRVDGALMHGTIDCLIRTPTGSMTILEFKTGRPREEHRVQLDLYRQAAERLFPGVPVETHLVYADEAPG